MAHNIPPQREAPQFTFNAEDQAAEWQRFYIKAIDYLEALDIDTDQEDDIQRGWKQIKMMFKGEDRQTLQTLLENNTITQEDQCIPSKALQAIQTTIKADDHFWHYRDEFFSDVRQQAHEWIQTLNTRITSLVNKCKFTNAPTKETVKIMLLAHAVKFHEARDWIRLQDQSTLTYTSLLNHC